MELTVKYLGATQFEAEARGHRILCDQPAENHGFDEGMTPPELLLAAIGTCAGYYAAEYLNARKLPAADLQIKVTAEKALKPARLARFVITVDAPGLTDPHHIDGLKKAVDKCLVKNTLAMPPEVEVNIVANAAAGV